MRNNHRKTPPGEWLFLSITVSLIACAIMRNRYDATYGLLTGALSLGLCWLSYCRKK